MDFDGLIWMDTCRHGQVIMINPLETTLKGWIIQKELTHGEFLRLITK